MMPRLDEIVIATGNPHKVEEIRAILGALGLRVLGLNDLPGHDSFSEPVEHGSTFEENARIKALSYAEQTGRVCLADDSGLEVDALRGAPGVISSHYATEGKETGIGRAARDVANNARLLRELGGIPFSQRTARFACVMCLAAGRRVLAATRGTFEGRIGIPPAVPRGENGFGYDPLLELPDGRTSAELSPEEKNQLSHRGEAARRMAAEIARLRSS